MEDDGDDKDDIKRKTRNLSEKKRRDQFNSLVTELSNLISNNNRKIDKSTVLRSTISFLKNHNEVTVRSRAHDVQEDWKPAFLSNEEFTYLVLEALEGFIMVFSASGRIHYASESVISLLGHNPDELVNQNIFNLMHEDDQQNLYNLLQGSTAAEQIENQSKENEMIRFQIHIRRGCLDFREEVSYDLVQFYGHFRTNQEQDNERDSMDFREVDPSSRILFVCIGCLHTPKLIRDVSLVDSTRNEFTSRHSLEWKFLFLDHRAPPIIGYLPFEVLGTSGYDYYHFDDLEKVVTCHEALMRKGELTSCFYRFLTKGQQWIWLQTRFYITYHQWNSKPEFVVCTHRVVSYAEVIKTKEEVIEQDTDMNEADNAASMNEMSVKDPPMSPPYNISEENADAYANAYQTISQARYIYNQKRATAAKKNLSHKISVANPQSKTFNDIKNQAIKSSRHSLVQVQAPEPQLSRPERPKSSLSALLECFPGPCDPPMQDILSLVSPDEYLQPLTALCSLETNPFNNSDIPFSRPASVKSASTCSTGGTITQTAVTTAGTWDCEQLGHAGRSDTPVSGESHTSQRNSKGELAKCMYYPKRSSVTKKDLFRKALVASLRSKAVRNIKNNIKQYSPSDIMNPCCVLERNNNTIKIPRALAGKDILSLEDEYLQPWTPQCSIETSSFNNSYSLFSKPASVKSASASSTGGTIAQAAVTTADTWDCTQARYTGGSDTSVSGESHISQRNSELELRVPQPQPPPQPQAHQPSKQDCIIAPQHVMGTQYLDPTSYVAGPISPGLLTATPLGPQDQAQIQEQLHRKHEELQQMIVRQQEELRQVKEQLLLARLGILQPLINVPANTYTTQAELQNQERMSQLTYTMAGPRPPLPYYTAQGPLQLALPSMSAQPPQQPHPDDQHMPQ